MHPSLRLAAGAAVLVAASALTTPIAVAAGECTPISNRSALARSDVAPRASTAIINASSLDVPRATVNGGTVVSKVTLSNAGIVRSVKVKGISLSHANLSELTLRLRAPDGTLVLLANGLAGANLSGTTFSDAAPSIFVGLPPYFGTFAPQDWLAQLYGGPIAGDWRLEISDVAGGAVGTLTAWAMEVTPESCGPQPTAAIVASPNPAAPGATVTFDASSSTGGDGSAIVRYEWDLDGDGSFETDTGSTAVTSRTYAVKGTYAIAVRVTDPSGSSDQRAIALAVTAKPVASMTITPDSPFSLVNAMLDASASSDSDGTIVRYEWDLDGDGTFEVDAGNFPTLQRLFGTSGPRTVGLKVTDDSGATAVALKGVLVQNRAPTAAFGLQATPAIIGAGTVVDASASVDLDGTITSYEWDFDDDGSYETGSGGSPTVTHVFAGSGVHRVGLRITDNGGDSDTTSRSIVATQAPVAQLGATPLVTRPQTLVTFDPAGSADPDPTGSIISYAWDFDGDGTVDETTTTGAPVSYAYAAFGHFTARLTVTDDLGAKGTATVVVRVQNDPPVAALSISPAAVLTGQTVTLSAAGSLDPDGPIARYEWDLDGNGTYELNSGTTATLARSFPNRMRVTVRVRVTDSDGATATASAALNVDPADPGPGVTAGGTGSGGAGTGAGSGGADPGSGAGAGAFTATLGGASIQALRRAIRRGVAVNCAVDRKATCVLEVVVQARDAKRLRLGRGKRAVRGIRIARGRATAAGAGSHAVTLKLSSKARRALRRARRIVVVVQGTATDDAGATATLSRAVMLR